MTREEKLVAICGFLAEKVSDEEILKKIGTEWKMRGKARTDLLEEAKKRLRDHEELMKKEPGLKDVPPVDETTAERNRKMKEASEGKPEPEKEEEPIPEPASEPEPEVKKEEEPKIPDGACQVFGQFCDPSDQECLACQKDFPAAFDACLLATNRGKQTEKKSGTRKKADVPPYDPMNMEQHIEWLRSNVESMKGKRAQNRFKGGQAGANRFGHRIGSQAASIDEMLLAGLKVTDAATELNTNKNRILSHIKHMKDRNFTVNKVGDVYTMLEEVKKEKAA